MVDPSRPTPSLVVGVGASAGGLEAFRELLSVIPGDSGMTFVLVQHLDPRHKSMLTELLAPKTSLRVIEATHGAPLEPNTAHVIPSNTELSIQDGHIVLGPASLRKGMRLPIDHLFDSLAREYGARAAGIVLSGAGQDGTIGLRHIKGRGGLTIVQEPTTATQTGMPRSAIEARVAELVLEIPDMPAALERFERLPTAVRIEPSTDEEPEQTPRLPLTDAIMERLTQMLRSQQSFDPLVYRRTTLERRIRRRMTLSGHDDIEAYVESLARDPEQQEALVRDLMISVTEFFRDPGAFETLRTLVVEPHVAAANNDETIRVWVPGCATGEEPYSIAMEFCDAIARSGRRIYLQVFASDIDRSALEIARAGVFPPSISEHVSSGRLDRYFERIDGRGYRLLPLLRDVVSFAEHDVCADPPFSRIHLVSFRNVLIYMHPTAQGQVLERLHFALRPNGNLMLGTAESVGPREPLFSPISKKWRLYRKIGASRPLLPGTRWPRRDRIEHDHDEDPKTMRNAGDILARQAVVERCLPACLAVTGDGTVIYMSGELRPYLHFPAGSPTPHLGSMLTPELATRVQTTVYRCRRDDAKVEAVCALEHHHHTKITAYPAPELGDGAVVLSFFALPDPVHVIGEPSDSDDAKIIAQLDLELRATREDLHNTVEELEIANEELRSSSEESMSINEELQSTNEELEATTEELRSLNEELRTVNTELREKIEQLQRAHDDLNNFLGSTKIATLFLDEELRIKRFTPAAEHLLRIGQDVEGVQVSDVARQLLQEGLTEQARLVLQNLDVQRSEIRTDSGQWVSRTVLPYRTQNRRIEGVVVNLVDISALKRTTEALAIREQQRAVVARLSLIALEDSGLQAFLDLVVREVQQTLDTDYCKILELEPGTRSLLLRAGIGWREGLVGRSTVTAGLDCQAGFTLSVQHPVVVEDLTKERRFTGPALLHEHEVISGVSCTIRDSSGTYGVLGAHSRSSRPFSGEDTNFLQSVAAVVAAAVSRHQVRLQLALENACGRALVESTDLPDAVRLIYETFAQEAGVSVGELWQLDDTSAGSLRRSALFCRAPFSRDRVEEALDEQTLHSPETAVGLSFTNRQALWLSVQTPTHRFVRADAARSLGLQSVLMLPVVAAQDALGVVCMFTQNRLYASRSLLQSLESIGRAVGESVRRTATEHELRSLATIAEAAQDAVMSLDLDGTITGWLPGAQRMYGYSKEQVLGSSVERIVPEDARDELWRQIARLRGGEPVDPFESVCRREDGTRLDVSICLSPVRDEQGRVVGLTKADRDITDQHRASAALARSEARFRSTFENAAVGIAHITPGPRLVCRRINDRMLELLGYSREEMLPLTLEDVTHPDHVNAELQDLRRLLSGKIDHFSAEKRYIRRDGTTLWVQETASLVHTTDGEPDYAILVVVDISSRREAEERRAQSEWRFRRVLLGSPIPTLVCDGSGRIVECSRSWTDMFGYGPDEITHVDQWAERVYGAHATSVLAYLERTWEGDESQAPPDVDAITKDGRRVTLMLGGAPLGRQEGQTLRLCTAADVTRQKNAERELIEAGRQKDEFLAMLGHELRNPLAAVHGAARLPGLEQIDDPDWRDARSILQRQTEHMSKLLDGLLDVSRIVRGKITLEVQQVDLRQIVSEVAGDHLARCRSKGLTLNLDLPPAPLLVQGDKTRLAQITDNLLSNAVKYTDEGSIDVRLRLDDAHATLTLRDTGIGIEPELIPRVFDSFRQAEQNLHRTRGGLGLGLALVRSLVELHGGRVEARSDGHTHGSEFVVWLPRSTTPAESATKESLATRVLLIEDETDLAHVLRRILSGHGHDVRIASHGQEGLDIAFEWAPEVVLCDIGLPNGLSGYEVAQKLRADARTKSTALVAVTGYGRPEDKARAFEVGFDAHITKPIKLDEFERVLTEVQRRRRRSPP